MVLIALSAYSQNKETLNVWMTDGTKSSVLLINHPIVVFNSSQLVIKSDSQTIEIPYDKVSHFSYTKEEDSSISDVIIGSDDKDEFWLFPEGSTTENIYVYMIDGQKIPLNVHHKGEIYVLNFASLASGVYIIKVNNKSYKITKK